MCPFGRLDPVAPAADRGQVEVLGRVDGYLVSADRPPEDDAQRIEDVREVAKERQAAAKDPGPPYRAVWHPEAEAERNASWPPEETVAMLHVVQKLEAVGPRLGSPHSSAVQGDAGQGYASFDRVLAAAVGGRSTVAPVRPTFVILAVAPEAQIDSRGFDAAVRRAVERFGQLELDGGPAWNCR